MLLILKFELEIKKSNYEEELTWKKENICIDISQLYKNKTFALIFRICASKLSH